MLKVKVMQGMWCREDCWSVHHPFQIFVAPHWALFPKKIHRWDAMKLLKQLGKGCFMAKTDVKSAFHIIPFHPATYSLLGLISDNMYYFDRCLAMGLSSSCAIFKPFRMALEWLSINHLGACAVLHILDDFLFITQSKEQSDHDLDNLILIYN